MLWSIECPVHWDSRNIHYLLTIGYVQTPRQEFVSGACLTQEVNLSGSIYIQSDHLCVQTLKEDLFILF